jgi:serine phosphatase RsbU (regulator of sigma subunit)
MSGGFATAIAMRLDPSGSCTLSTAGHPAPFLNQRGLDLPGALPLGLAPVAEYEEHCFKLQVGDHFALYTDGLLEARNHAGELYGFERLEKLFATRPNATQATEAAVNFGQDDDITVLTLTRLAKAEEPKSRFLYSPDSRHSSPSIDVT